MKTILLIGNGARDHVIAETFKRSPQEVSVVVFGKAKNPGLAALADAYCVAALNDFSALGDFVAKTKPDFAFIGPENPLRDGVVDFLEDLGVPSVGPNKVLAQLESSKSFTRDLVTKYGIPGNPKFKVFATPYGLREYMEELGGEYVVKADGLHGGKGVKLSGEHLATVEDGVMFAEECIESDGRVVIEEKFVGEEFSHICFADGNTVVPCPVTQDHKRAYEGDEGPNTGGMGSYGGADGSLPFLTGKDLADAQAITEQVMHALKEETGEDFRGILFGGFIAVKDGVRLIEYNARFGDPEVMNILPLLKTDFVSLCEAVIQGKLDEIDVEFEKKATVLKYVVPEGYPVNSVKNVPVTVGETPEGVKLYFGSIDEQEGQLLLGGSRAIAVVGLADDLATAETLSAEAIKVVEGPVFYRSDIGTSDLIQKRITHLKEIRG